MPYRRVRVQRLQEANDERAGIGSRPDPPPSHLESEALNRAWESFCLRGSKLMEAFGQMIDATIGSAEELWRQMRLAKGDLNAIQKFLYPMGRSLLGDYRCLRQPA